MSASEKMRALEPITLTVDDVERELVLYDIPLPQIVAVVEAAERADRDGKWNVDLRMSLAALDEALK